jgi:hypothetical protein
MIDIIYNEWMLISALGFLFAYLFVFEPYAWLMENYLQFKPFNCVLCLSFWSSMVIFALLGHNPLHAIYVAIIAELTYRKLVL